MRVEAAQADIAGLLRPLSKADIFARPASAVLAGARRLEAGFYGSEGYRALRTMENSGFVKQRIVEVAKVFWPGIFSRRYVDDPSAGVPFVSSSGMLNARLERKSYLSRTLTLQLDSLMATEGTILVSRSGTIGSVAICTKDYDGFAISDDAIRVTPVEEIDRGVIYVFLLSELGRFLVTRQKSGSVIEHLYAEDIENLTIPKFPKRLCEALSKNIAKASDLRVRANGLLADAEAAVQIASARVASVGAGTSFFVQPASAVQRAREYEGYSRLDATYYDPQVLALRAQASEAGGQALVKSAPGIKLIGKTFVEGVHKVDREYGVPYFTGKELFKTRPVPETFITSEQRASIDKLLVRRGTTLVTCAGTVGKVMYVRGSLEGCAITHDAIRVLPGAGIHPGYVYAYLASPGGQAELKRCSYGSVIPRLYRTHIENVIIPKAKDGGAEIGRLVDEAFDLRQEALETENAGIELFLQCLSKGRLVTEGEWGMEY